MFTKSAGFSSNVIFLQPFRIQYLETYFDGNKANNFHSKFSIKSPTFTVNFENNINKLNSISAISLSQLKNFWLWYILKLKWIYDVLEYNSAVIESSPTWNTCIAEWLDLVRMIGLIRFGPGMAQTAECAAADSGAVRFTKWLIKKKDN